MRAKSTKNGVVRTKPTQAEVKQHNQETYGENIRKFRQRVGMSADELADLLQIARSSVRNWEAGFTRPDPDYMYSMFSILNVEPNEFFGIKGIGTLMTTNERTLIDNYRMLDDEGKEDLETIAQSLRERAYNRKLKRSYERTSSIDTAWRVVAAGDGADWEEHPEVEKVVLYDNPEVARANEIFIVNGDSMEPQYHSGDHVLVEYCSADDLKNGDIGIFYVPGYGGVIKQKAYDRLHSLNPAFDDIFPYEDGAKVIGRVLGKITGEMIPTAEERMIYEEACAVFENNRK